MNLMLILIITIILLFFLSASFSGSETAYTSLDEVTLSRLVREKKITEKDKKLWEKPNEVLAALLVGNNIVNIINPVLVTILAGQFARSTGILTKEASIVVSTAILTIMVLLFAEVLPKTFARTHQEGVAPFTSGVARLSLILFKPLILLVTGVTNLVMKVFSSGKKGGGAFASVEDLETILTLGHKEGIIKKHTLDLLKEVIEFRSITVEEIMLPRVDMESIEMETPIDDIITHALETGYSRFPVYEETVDHIIGVLNLKPVLKDYVNSKNDKKAINYIMLPYFVPEGKPINTLFREMQKNKIHMAIVIDEYGGTAGLVTLEDILEEIVGEIEDENEKERPNIELRGKRYFVKGNTPLNEINEDLNLNLQHEEYQTIAGYILETLGYIPKQNERFKMNNYMVKVRRVEDRRIMEVEFVKMRRAAKKT